MRLPPISTQPTSLSRAYSESLHKPLLHSPVLYETEDDLFHYLKDILTGESKPLPKASLQNINKHLDWSERIDQFDTMFEECQVMDIISALS